MAVHSAAVHALQGTSSLLGAVSLTLKFLRKLKGTDVPSGGGGGGGGEHLGVAVSSLS